MAYGLAQHLAFLRDEGALVLASGSIVHNLRLLRQYWNAPSSPDWALRFRDRVSARVGARDHAAPCDWHTLGAYGALAVPTPEHHLPLLYALVLQREDDYTTTINDDVFATLAMTSFLIAPRS